jgi:hypothetical protein
MAERKRQNFMRFKAASAPHGDANTIWQGYIRPWDVIVASLREAELSGFDKRERAEEGKFALDQELRFKANARRNKLLGLWAAEQLGKTGEAASAYATEVVKSDFEAPGDDDVFRKVRGDFDKAGVKLTDHQIQRQMTELMETAVAQVKSEKK